MDTLNDGVKSIGEICIEWSPPDIVKQNTDLVTNTSNNENWLDFTGDCKVTDKEPKSLYASFDLIQIEIRICLH
jgi:hypothetical protein